MIGKVREIEIIHPKEKMQIICSSDHLLIED